MVRSYMTGRTIIPDYARRTKVEVIVSDSATNQIVDDSIKQSWSARWRGGTRYDICQGCLRCM